jgi:hypothetical protein
MVDQGHAAAAAKAGACARGVYLGRRGEQRRREDRGRILEYGTAVAEANWSMLWWARWLIPGESAEVLGTQSG